MSNIVKIPKLEDVADALGVKCPKTTGIYEPSLKVKGVTVKVKKEGGYRYGCLFCKKAAIVIETGGYGREQKRRKLYVWKGSACHEHDTIVRRALTKDETAKLKEKLAEMVKEQKAINEASKARDESYEARENAREAIEKAIKKAGIEQFGNDELEGVSLSVYTDRPHIDIRLYDKTPEQIVAIYKAVEKALKGTGG